jgi:hypothetical protein
MRRFWSWNLPKQIVTAILAVAAAVATLGGGIRGVLAVVHWWQDRNVVKTETLFDRTPRLGMEFWQAGKPDPMRYRDASEEVVRVEMERSSFQLRVPAVAKKTAVQICAWTDDSIFRLRQGVRTEQVPFFSPGTGIADTEFASGTLYLNDEAHNYLVGTRLRRRPDSKDEAFFATVFSGTRSRRPLTAQKGPLFLTVYIDRNANQIVELGEYEYVELDF